MIYRITGELVTDTGTATGTLLADPSQKEWSSFLLDVVDLPEPALPPIQDPVHIVGELKKDFAARAGLPGGVKVVTGTLDSAAELLGSGVLGKGEGMVRVGTAGGIMLITDEPTPIKGALLYPYPIEPYWYYQAGTNSCTSAFNWVKSLLFDDEMEYAEIDRCVQSIPPGSDGLVFHPYLLGERAPYWNPELRGGFNGLSMAHGKAHLLRAVQEGVGFSLLDCLRFLSSRLDYRIENLKVAGGASQSEVWSRILADILGLPLMHGSFYSSVYGMALLALLAWNGGGNFEDTLNLSRSVHNEKIISPRADVHDIYKEGFEKYKRISRFLPTLHSPV